MAKIEWCKCSNFSCEDALDPKIRFRFVKDHGMITNRVTLDGIDYKSGITENSIANCELKCRVHYKDIDGDHNWQGDKHKRK